MHNSFYIGGASSVAAAGIPDSTIHLLCRWSSDSYQQYIHILDGIVINLAICISSTLNVNRFRFGCILFTELINYLLLIFPLFFTRSASHYFEEFGVTSRLLLLSSCSSTICCYGINNRLCKYLYSYVRILSC